MRQKTASITGVHSSLLGLTAARLKAAALAVVVLVATPAMATRFDELPPDLQQTLKASPLYAPGVPFAKFSWVYEQKRSGRGSREVHEAFDGAKDGFSTVHVFERRGDQDTEPRQRLSVRGLFRLDPTPERVEVNFDGLKLPPAQGAKFALTLMHQGKSLTQQCEVQGRQAAKEVVAEIPGQVANISCSGRGRFQGFDVKVSSDLLWFDALGVFLMQRERLDAGIIKYEESNRLTQFKLGGLN